MSEQKQQGIQADEDSQGSIGGQQNEQDSGSSFFRAEDVGEGNSWEGEVYRPVHRPKVPMLVVLDDGRNDRGEVVRLRKSSVVIGRSDADVCLPHDSLISKRHAELARTGEHADAYWQLRDLESANKTFVRCREVVLDPTIVMLIGSFFYRFKPFDGTGLKEGGGDHTVLALQLPGREVLCPVFEQQAEGGKTREFPLSSKKLTLGRPGFGNDISIDDPLLAERHAEIRQSKDGSWRMTPLPSRNGIWVSIHELRLGRRCRFRCGEQEFLFVGS